MRHIFSIKLEKFVPHFQETSGWRFVNLWYPLVLSIQLSFLLLFFHFIELLLFNLSLIHKYMFLALDRACRNKNQYYCDVLLYGNDGSHNLFLFYVHFTCIYFSLLSTCESHLPQKYSTLAIATYFIFWWQWFYGKKVWHKKMWNLWIM